jgi:hypothetical protein
MTCKGLVFLLKVFVPLLSLTHLLGPLRPLRVAFTLFSRTSATIHCSKLSRHQVGALVAAHKLHWQSSYVPVVSH